MRHAKSAWDNPDLPDHDRPLNDRGRHAAPVMGRWLATQGLVPDQVLTSSARRTLDTLAGLGLGPTPTQVLPQLYHAEPDTILTALRDHATGTCVLVLGHNPGLSLFAGRFVTNPMDHPRLHDLPTGGTLVVDLTVAWGAVDWGTGHAHSFAAPRDFW